MDKDRIVANQPAEDWPPETADTGTLDPNRIWSPQPSSIYDLQDRAAAEGAPRPDVIAQADRQMAERQDTTGGCAAQGHPFLIPDHEVQHTGAVVKTDLPDLNTGLRSGQGQSGFGEEPTIVPTRGPAGEVSIISLPAPASAREGT
jgi:hypothetical protein